MPTNLALRLSTVSHTLVARNRKVRTQESTWGKVLVAGLILVTVGIIFTSLFWEVAKQCFSWYVLHLGKFSAVYGSLGTLAIFFLWVYYSAAILLLGGEAAFFLEKGRK